MRAVKGVVTTIDADLIVVGLGVGLEFVAGRLADAGGRFVRGRAAVTGNRTVVVGGQEFRASRGLVLATGPSRRFPRSTGWPATLTGPIMRLWRRYGHLAQEPKHLGVARNLGRDHQQRSSNVKSKLCHA
jgi:hypothetical protein